MRLFVVCLVSGLAMTGCGSSEPQFTREEVEASMTDLHRGQLKNRGTMDTLACVQDGDEFHWRCIADVRQDGQLFSFSTMVTCDAETGKCISEPQGLDPA